jgi:hypothetical protein
MSSMSGGKTVRVILILWFCLALIVGISGRFRVVSAPIVAATVWTSTAVALFAYWKSPGNQKLGRDCGSSLVDRVCILRDSLAFILYFFVDAADYPKASLFRAGSATSP